jgi:hypothetical protein
MAFCCHTSFTQRGTLTVLSRQQHRLQFKVHRVRAPGVLPVGALLELFYRVSEFIRISVSGML